jgi:hypothetical protein
MPKISTYGIKAPPVASDMLVGTDTTNTPPNQTKNFTAQDLSDFVTNDLQYLKVVIPGGVTVQELPANPYDLIPAPGVGKAIVLFDFFFGTYPYEAPAYNFPTPVEWFVEYVNGAGVVVYTWQNLGSNTINNPNPMGLYLQNNSTYDVFPDLENCKVRLKVTAPGNATTGASNLNINSTYKIYSVN